MRTRQIKGIMISESDAEVTLAAMLVWRHQLWTSSEHATCRSRNPERICVYQIKTDTNQTEQTKKVAKLHINMNTIPSKPWQKIVCSFDTAHPPLYPRICLIYTDGSDLRYYFTPMNEKPVLLAFQLHGFKRKSIWHLWWRTKQVKPGEHQDTGFWI